MTKSNGVQLSDTKIMSTYQNGNLFGIGLLLIYPLVYSYYNKRKNRKMCNLSLVLFIVCIFLTLSRACWLGYALSIFIEIFLKSEKTIKSILKKFSMIRLFAGVMVLIFNYVPQIANRFFNTDLDDWISMNGRTEGLIVGIIECRYWLLPTALNIFMLIALGYSHKKFNRKEGLV